MRCHISEEFVWNAQRTFFKCHCSTYFIYWFALRAVLLRLHVLARSVVSNDTHLLSRQVSISCVSELLFSISTIRFIRPSLVLVPPLLLDWTACYLITLIENGTARIRSNYLSFSPVAAKLSLNAVRLLTLYSPYFLLPMCLLKTPSQATPTECQRLLLILHHSVCSLSCALASAVCPAYWCLLLVQHVSICCLHSIGCSFSISAPVFITLDLLSRQIMPHSIYRLAWVAFSSQLYFYCTDTSLNFIVINWIQQQNASFYCTWVVSKHNNRCHVPISGGSDKHYFVLSTARTNNPPIRCMH